MKSITHILLGIAVVAAAAFGQGTVSGVLNDEKGKAYADGAAVLVVKVAQSPDGFEPFVSNTITAKDGSFRIGNVPAGKYEICVTVQGTDYVDSCRWGKAVATALVTNGGNAQTTLALIKGRIFTIELKDDDGYLDRHEGKSIGGFLNMGVFTEQRDLVEARIATLTKTARKYRVVVPAGVKFRVRAQSPLFDLKTETDPVQSLAVLQDLDQVIDEKDLTKGVTLKVSGIKALEVGK